MQAVVWIVKNLARVLRDNRTEDKPLLSPIFSLGGFTGFRLMFRPFGKAASKPGMSSLHLCKFIEQNRPVRVHGKLTMGKDYERSYHFNVDFEEGAGGWGSINIGTAPKPTDEKIEL